jgi:rod shape determining protein RodA
MRCADLAELERRWRDVWLLTIALLLAGMGILFIVSVGYVGDRFVLDPAYRQQIRLGCIGLLCYLGLARTDYRRLTGVVWLGYVVSVVLLVVTLYWGDRINDARRWLTLFGVFRFQPAGPARIFALLACSAWLAQPPVRLKGWRHAGIGLLILLTPTVLIHKEPAAGNALTLGAAGMGVLLLWTGRIRLVKGLGILALLSLVALAPAVHWVRGLELDKDMTKAVLEDLVREHQSIRIVNYIDPVGDPDNERQISICLVSGGMWGKGLFRGDVQKGGFLPRAVASSDFVIATIGEEAGFFGCLAVLALCGALIVLCGRVAEESQDPWGRLFCIGFMLLFSMQVLISVGMAVRLFPIIGLTIPLLGRGGTLIISAFLGLGFVTSVHRHTVPGARRPSVDPLDLFEPRTPAMYPGDDGTVVFELIPFGPLRLRARVRWASAAGKLEGLASDTWQQALPAPMRKARKVKDYQATTYELPGIWDCFRRVRPFARRRGPSQPRQDGPDARD